MFRKNPRTGTFVPVEKRTRQSQILISIRSDEERNAPVKEQEFEYSLFQFGLVKPEEFSLVPDAEPIAENVQEVSSPQTEVPEPVLLDQQIETPAPEPTIKKKRNRKKKSPK